MKRLPYIIMLLFICSVSYAASVEYNIRIEEQCPNIKDNFEWKEVSKTSSTIQCEICGKIEIYYITTLHRYTNLTNYLHEVIIFSKTTTTLEGWLNEPWYICHYKCLRKLLKGMGAMKYPYDDTNKRR